MKKNNNKNSVKLSQCMHRSTNQKTKPGEAHSWIMLESVGHSTHCLIVKLFPSPGTESLLQHSSQRKTLAATTATKSQLLIYRLPVRAENLNVRSSDLIRRLIKV